MDGQGMMGEELPEGTPATAPDVSAASAIVPDPAPGPEAWVVEQSGGFALVVAVG